MYLVLPLNFRIGKILVFVTYKCTLKTIYEEQNSKKKMDETPTLSSGVKSCICHSWQLIATSNINKCNLKLSTWCCKREKFTILKITNKRMKIDVKLTLSRQYNLEKLKWRHWGRVRYKYGSFKLETKVSLLSKQQFWVKELQSIYYNIVFSKVVISKFV